MDLLIVDDGDGMSPEHLREAMRFGLVNDDLFPTPTTIRFRHCRLIDAAVRRLGMEVADTDRSRSPTFVWKSPAKSPSISST